MLGTVCYIYNYLSVILVLPEVKFLLLYHVYTYLINFLLVFSRYPYMYSRFSICLYRVFSMLNVVLLWDGEC